MDKTKLESFIKWLPINKEEFKSSTPNEIVNRLNSLYESDDGKQTLTSLWTAFEQGETGMFRKGGKLDYLLTLSKGGCVSCQKGGIVSVIQDNIQQEASDRNWLTKQINRKTELGQMTNLHPTMKLQDGDTVPYIDSFRAGQVKITNNGPRRRTAINQATGDKVDQIVSPNLRDTTYKIYPVDRFTFGQYYYQDPKTVKNNPNIVEQIVLGRTVNRPALNRFGKIFETGKN